MRLFTIAVAIVFIVSLLFYFNCEHALIIGSNLNDRNSDYKDLKDLKYRYGLLLHDENMNYMTEREIVYSKSNIKRIVTFVNLTEEQSKFMLIVLLNGVLQKFSAFDNEMGYTYQSIIEPNNEMNIPISIQCDEKYFASGDNRLLFTVIYDIDKKPAGSNDHILFYSCTFPCEIVLSNMDIRRLFKPTFADDSIVKRPKNLSKAFNETLYTSICDNEIGQEMVHRVDFTFNSKEAGKVKVQTVGPPGEYSSILFCDNEPVYVDNIGTSIFFKIDENNMFSRTYDVPYKNEGQLYVLTIPLDTSPKYPITSEKSIYYYVE